ncbi:MAG: hypothetical protein LBP20_01115 [Treponema sp.]|jgi:hypothetical protein|nr:hypothetical protein [Treponema sp.]
MPSHKHLIPPCGPKYDRFFKNIVQYVGLMCGGSSPQWTHIPQAEVTILTNAYADWYTGYSRTLKPHLPADTAAMKDAYPRSSKILSRFIQVWIRGYENSKGGKEEEGSFGPMLSAVIP